jgi:hypothetical protein
MQTPNNDLKEHLTRYRQIKISVIGRKSGWTISIPVWFRVGMPEALPLARAGFGYTVVQQRAPEPVDSD